MKSLSRSPMSTAVKAPGPKDPGGAPIKPYYRGLGGARAPFRGTEAEVR